MHTFLEFDESKPTAETLLARSEWQGETGVMIRLDSESTSEALEVGGVETFMASTRPFYYAWHSRAGSCVS